MSHLPIILVTHNHVATSLLAEAQALAIGQKLNRKIVSVSLGKQAYKKLAFPISALEMQQINGRIAQFWRLLKTNFDAAGIAKKAARLDAHFCIISIPSGNFITKIFYGFRAANIARLATCPVLIIKKKMNKSYRKVLIATDFSVASKSAALAALSFACEAEFSAVHAYTLPNERLMHELGLRPKVIKRYHSEVADRAIQNLAHFVASLQSAVAFENYVVHGAVPSTIRTYASWIDADLIGIGKSAGVGLWSLLTKCLVRQLLQKTRCDVLVAPATIFDNSASQVSVVAKEKHVAHL
jgi:nucleotide-binding universal stress UspA family protein